MGLHVATPSLGNSSVPTQSIFTLTLPGYIVTMPRFWLVRSIPKSNKYRTYYIQQQTTSIRTTHRPAVPPPHHSKELCSVVSLSPSLSTTKKSSRQSKTKQRNVHHFGPIDSSHINRKHLHTTLSIVPHCSSTRFVTAAHAFNCFFFSDVLLLRDSRRLTCGTYTRYQTNRLFFRK